MAVSKLGASSRFNLILFLYGSIVFYSFLCLVLFVYFGCFGLAGFSLEIGTYHFNLDQYFHRFSYFALKTQQNQNHHSDPDDDESRDLVPENKPKPPIIINRDSPNSLRSLLLEVSDGCDIFECITKYALKRQRGIYISSGSGTVSNVSLRQPSAQVAGQVVSLHGTFEILSLSGSFLPQPAPSSALVPSLTIFLAGGQGQVVGGVVVSELMAVGPVTLIASWFTNVPYERLPLEEEEETLNEVRVGNVRSGGSESDRTNDPSADQSSELPLSPLNMPPNHVQLPVDAWLGDSGGRPQF
ncbi:AT-hook motif nuclear-localized protein [Heracleum sosnowskyi]|uniref:AT-hook motif nuclear-localized protein n=1 Tax=Heracleum sosnowskyi TaxID=360622 RepID=A0AAD8HX78_9APIA|nr:AT-hook motif nuclear-localized protein [Heracleum sosnowskyi]